jgi:hypothetical protein
MRPATIADALAADAAIGISTAAPGLHRGEGGKALCRAASPANGLKEAREQATSFGEERAACPPRQPCVPAGNTTSDIVVSLRNRLKHFVIDGEAVVLGVDGISDFNALHSRKHDHEVQLMPSTFSRWTTPICALCPCTCARPTWSDF